MKSIEGTSEDRRLGVQAAVAGALAGAGDVATALAQIMSAVCRALGCRGGELWLIDSSGALRRRARHGVESGEVSEEDAGPGFEQAARAVESGRAEWARVPSEGRTGDGSVLALPILGSADPLGAMVFLVPAPQEPERPLLDLLEAVGGQVGQFLERRRIEARAREVEVRRAAILDASLDPIVAVDEDGRLVEFNPAAERTFGYRREDVLGRDAAELLLPERTHREFRERLARYRRAAQPASGRLDLGLLRSDGTEFPAEAAFAVVQLPDRILFKAHVRDMTRPRRIEAALRESRDRLDGILRNIGDAITVQDRGGRLLYANEAAARLIGYPSAEALLSAPLETVMDRFEMIDEAGEPFPPQRLPGRRVLSGEVREAEALIGYRLEETGAVRWSRVKSSAVLAEDGRVSQAINVLQDVTASRHQQEERAFLAEVTRVLSSSLDVGDIVSALGRLVVPRLADWSVVHLLEQDGRVRSLVWNEDLRGKEETQRHLERHPVERAQDRVASRVLRTGRAELHVTVEELARGVDEERAASSRRLGVGSLLAVPLTARGSVRGALVLVYGASGRRYGPEHVAMAEELGRRAGTAVDNARLYEERSRIARVLQQSLIPQSLPVIPGVELAARHRPFGAGNDVGGDFFDVFQVAEQVWAVAIGDVQGKGPEAAAVVGVARHTLRGATMQERDPVRALQALNRALLDHRPRRMCTLVFALLRRQGDALHVTLARAGHPPPFLITSGGDVREVGHSGTVLGAYPDPLVDPRSFILEPGDRLVLYTDGVTLDRREGPLAIEQALDATYGQTASRMAEELERRVVEAHDEGLLDDLALVVVRASEPSAPVIGSAAVGEAGGRP